MRLQGKTAIITGAGSGIGQASAWLFARNGAFVVLVDRDEAGMQETLAGMPADSGALHAADVSDLARAQSIVDETVDRRGRVDVLMTSAGFACRGTVVTVDPDDWDAVFKTNVGGTWLWARAVVPVMQRQGSGSIITIASQLAIAGAKNNSAYVASKGAIISLTRTMAVDFAADGVRVNAIAPGATETPMLRRNFGRHPDPESVRDASRERHAMKRFGRPEEIAETALHLASDASSFTTGTVMPVDGGWTAA
jgi:2-keto-3-deoxy-L-fuconate dehydrogenase